MNRLLLSHLALVFLAAPAALAQPLPTTSYQGYLEQNGAPVNSPNATLTFRLFRTASGGSALWTETKTGVAIADGVFNVALGSQVALTNTLFDGLLFLSVAVGGAGAPQLSPRTVFRSVPYARTLSVPARVVGPAPSGGSALHVENTAYAGEGLNVELPIGNPNYAIDASGGSGVFGVANTGGGIGVTGLGVGLGVYGYTYERSGTGVRGLAASNDSGSDGIGVHGESRAISGIGVFGHASTGGGTNYAIYGTTNSPQGYGGFFVGNVHVTGLLSKGGGAFQIDHPLDPEHRILRHSFVESPDMMNVYNGNVTTDRAGYATVVLPDWFEALNRDFRYQLTTIGSFSRAMIAEEIQGNRFVIRTEEPGVRVSWQVTGIRQDAWANEHRIVVEEDKKGEDRGLYLHPSAFGQPRERGVDYDPGREARLAAMDEEHARRDTERARREASPSPSRDQ
jgi:hypothetical protein